MSLADEIEVLRRIAKDKGLREAEVLLWEITVEKEIYTANSFLERLRDRCQSNDDLTSVTWLLHTHKGLSKSKIVKDYITTVCEDALERRVSRPTLLSLCHWAEIPADKVRDWVRNDPYPNGDHWEEFLKTWHPDLMPRLEMKKVQGSLHIRKKFAKDWPMLPNGFQIITNHVHLWWWVNEMVLVIQSPKKIQGTTDLDLIRELNEATQGKLFEDFKRGIARYQGKGIVSKEIRVLNTLEAAR